MRKLIIILAIAILFAVCTPKASAKGNYQPATIILQERLLSNGTYTYYVEVQYTNGDRQNIYLLDTPLQVAKMCTDSNIRSRPSRGCYGD